MNVKLFNFMGTPVTISLFFFLLFFFFQNNIFIVPSLFFIVLMHEMGHAFVSKKLGWDVEEININIIGGYAAIQANNIPAKDHLKISAAGPITNLLLFIIGICINYFLESQILKIINNINIILFLFNMLPIKGLDGWHILLNILEIKDLNRNKVRKIMTIISLLICLTGIFVFYNISFLTTLFFIFILFSDKDNIKKLIYK